MVVLSDEGSDGHVTVERRVMSMKHKGYQKQTSISQEYQPLNITNRDHPNAMSEEKEADLQGNKIVEINRMLADDQYSVGKQLQEFKVRFILDLEADTNFKDASKYVVSSYDQMRELANFSQIIQQTISSPGNLGNEKMKNWIPLAHSESEKFIYKMVYDKLFDKFATKYSASDKIFLAKTQQLMDFGDRDLLKNLEVDKKFVLGDTENQYIDAIMELSKIESFQTPKSKLVDNK